MLPTSVHDVRGEPPSELFNLEPTTLNQEPKPRTLQPRRDGGEGEAYVFTNRKVGEENARQKPKEQETVSSNGCCTWKRVKTACTLPLRPGTGNFCDWHSYLTRMPTAQNCFGNFKEWCTAKGINEGQARDKWELANVALEAAEK
jgi:hypothetical protein